MARSRGKDVVAVGMGMEVTMEARSIHHLDICSLVCDMLKSVRGHGKRFGACITFALHGIGWCELGGIKSTAMTCDLE